MQCVEGAQEKMKYTGEQQGIGEMTRGMQMFQITGDTKPRLTTNKAINIPRLTTNKPIAQTRLPTNKSRAKNTIYDYIIGPESPSNIIGPDGPIRQKVSNDHRLTTNKSINKTEMATNKLNIDQIGPKGPSKEREPEVTN